MYKNESLEKIIAIHRRCGDVQFRAALQHLFDMGRSNFTEENVAATKEDISKNTPQKSIMTAEFQLELIDAACELSKLSAWDVLLYIKLYIKIKGDDLLELDEAEQALSSWNDALAPQSWKATVGDSELREDILREMVEQHVTDYTMSEVRDAIRCIAEKS